MCAQLNLASDLSWLILTDDNHSNLRLRPFIQVGSDVVIGLHSPNILPWIENYGNS